MQGRLAKGTYLSSGLPQYISQTGANDSYYKHVLMPKRKELER